MGNSILIKSTCVGKSTRMKKRYQNEKALSACDVIYYNLVVFVALRPKSTAMVIAGRSVHLTTLFPGQA